MRPFYADDQVELYLADSASFIQSGELGRVMPDGGMVISDPPNDRATDFGMWRRLRDMTGSLHLTANVGVLDDWMVTLKDAGFGFQRATPWPRQKTLHGDHWDALLHYGQDPGAVPIVGQLEYEPETEFPGERNRYDWLRIIEALDDPEPDEVAFDPFPGSGSLLLAAAECGWRAIGVEIEHRFAVMAADRLRSRKRT